jgi:sorbitol-specific phosphotransferase system component IIBC
MAFSATCPYILGTKIKQKSVRGYRANSYCKHYFPSLNLQELKKSHPLECFPRSNLASVVKIEDDSYETLQNKTKTKQTTTKPKQQQKQNKTKERVIRYRAALSNDQRFL